MKNVEGPAVSALRLLCGATAIVACSGSGVSSKSLPPERSAARISGAAVGTVPAKLRNSPMSASPGWHIPTSTPVRTAPAGFGAFVSPAPTDIVAFGVDNYAPASITSPGITAATAPTSIANWSTLTPDQQTEAEQSTIFLLTNLYGTTPTLLGWSNSTTTPGAPGNYTADIFGHTWLTFSFDSQNLELYALGLNGHMFCWDIPAAASTIGYAPSQVGPLVPCANWSTAGSSGSSATVTHSQPYPTYGGAGDVAQLYWGDDAGNLNCLVTGSAPDSASGGVAPSSCSTAYTAGAFALGTKGQLGPPIVYNQSSTESWIYLGDQYGTVYRIDDVQGLTPSITTSMYCVATGAVGAPCPPTTTADYAVWGALSGDGDSVFFASHGTLFSAPASGTGTNGAWVAADIKSLPLFTPTVGAPILSGVVVDYNESPPFAYVATNNHLYKTHMPFDGTVYATSLYRKPEPGLTQSIVLSPSDTVSVPPTSWPVGFPLVWYESIFVPSGYGNAQAAGSVGAPVSSPVLTPTLSGGVEQYGCMASADNPFLADVTTANYGASVETSMIIDYEAGNLYFGYDTGGASPSGGFVQQPASTNPTTGWGCPAPSTRGTACGSTTACVGAPAAGKCVNDSDCVASAPYCDFFPDSAFGTCVACRADTQCPQAAGAHEVCDTNRGLYECVQTARCAADSQCTNATDNPDYNASLTMCVTTPSGGFDLCVSNCASNAACIQSTSTPVCDIQNPSFRAFGTCVECTADTDCTWNDEYLNAGLTHCDQNPGSANFDHCAACINNAQCSGGTVCDTTAAGANSTYFDTCVACDSVSTSACAAPKTCDTNPADGTYDQCVSP